MANEKLVRIKNRIDTAANWNSNNPILAKGEMGIDSDNNKIKIGDGLTNWNDLDYQNMGTNIYKDMLFALKIDPSDNSKIITDKDLNKDCAVHKFEYYPDSTGISDYVKYVESITGITSTNGVLSTPLETTNSKTGTNYVYLVSWYNVADGFLKEDTDTYQVKVDLTSDSYPRLKKSINNDIKGNANLLIGAEYSHVEGQGNLVCDDFAHAEGERTAATASRSHAEGNATVASGSCSHAEGIYTKSIGHSSHSEGGTTIASGSNSHAEGDKSQASGYASHAEGGATKAIGGSSHSEGYGTTASGDSSHAEGLNTISSGNYSHAEGSDSEASGNYSHTEGHKTKATGGISHAEGFMTTASGDSSHAEGDSTTASGIYSHAEGNSTIAASENQHVQGKHNKEDTENKYAHIVGNGSSSSYRSNAHTLDWSGNAWYKGKIKIGGSSYDDTNAKTVATTDKLIGRSGNGTNAEIFNSASEASGSNSHAEGLNTKASGNASHAEGAQTIASNGVAHAEGYLTTASGDSSHAEGNNTVAAGQFSHSEGYYTKASSKWQHVQGKNNIEDTDNKYAHIVGNGENSSNKSNAHTLDWSGNSWYAGNIKIGGTSYDDTNAKEIATTDQLDLYSPKNKTLLVTKGDNGHVTFDDSNLYIDTMKIGAINAFNYTCTNNDWSGYCNGGGETLDQELAKYATTKSVADNYLKVSRLSEDKAIIAEPSIDFNHINIDSIENLSSETAETYTLKVKTATWSGLKNNNGSLQDSLDTFATKEYVDNNTGSGDRVYTYINNGSNSKSNFTINIGSIDLDKEYIEIQAVSGVGKIVPILPIIKEKPTTSVMIYTSLAQDTDYGVISLSTDKSQIVYTPRDASSQTYSIVGYGINTTVIAIIHKRNN